MKVILKMLANWLFEHGKANAAMASVRGSYEAPVPQCLCDSDKD